MHASRLHSLAPLGKPSARLGGPVRQSVVHSRLVPQLPAPTSTASPATAPPLLAAPPARPADRAQLHAGSAGGMVPSREGERPCRRLALLQPEAQLPVTRVGEQGAPPRRVGRLLSECGARPPPPSVPGSTGSARAGGGRAHPLAPLKVRAFHAGGLGSGPGPGPPPPKNLPSRRLTLSGVLYPSRQEWSSRWGLTGRSETGCASRWIECAGTAATLRRPWPGAPATGPPQYDRTVSDFLLWKGRPGRLHLLPARAGPTRADNHSKVRWSEDVGWLRQLRKALSRSRSQLGGD